MFARLGALASKKPPAPPASSLVKTTSSTLPARREREEEEETQKQETEEREKQQENQNNTSENNVDDVEGENNDDDEDQPSPFRKSYADYTLQEEKDLIHELRTKIATHEEALQQYENQLHVGHESQSQSKNTREKNSTGNNNSDQEHDEVILKDNILFSWISLQLSRWHFELMSKKRSTDPMDMDAIDSILEKLKSFDSSNEHIQPMLVGFQSHQLPRELTDALFKVYNFVVHEKNFIEAENIYFDYLLGSANWHIGVYTMLHQRASHESFKVGNVKSKLHNHELRKMMIAFKELINLEKRRYEESKKKTA